MNIISRPTLNSYCLQYTATKKYLLDWYNTTKKADWNDMNDLQRDFPKADNVGGKIIFNIKANDFRLVALVLFRKKKVLLLWFGTHAEYDKIKIKDL